MATLLDTLKKNLGQVSAPEAVADETGTVQQLLSARKGIVGPQSQLGPKGFSVAEAAARAPAQQQLAETRQAAQLQSTAIGQEAAAQAEEQKQREASLSAQRQQSQLQSRIQTESILRNLEQNRAALSEDKRRSGMEQVAANLRFQNQAYIDNLQREGTKARLQDSYAFDTQLKNQIADDNIALLKLQLGNKAAIDASDREFQKMLAQIDIDTAIRMQKENASFAAQQQKIQAIGQTATTGIAAGGKYYEDKSAGKFDKGYQGYAERTKERGGTPVSYGTYQERTQAGPPKPGTF